MEEGYLFMWPSSQMPFLLSNEGTRIDLSLHDNIPYIDLGADSHPLRGDHMAHLESSSCFPRMARMVNVDMVMLPELPILDGSSGEEVDSPGSDKKKKKNGKFKTKKRQRKKKPRAVPADDEDDGGYAPGTRYDGPVPDTDDEGEVRPPAPDAPPPDPNPEGNGRDEEHRGEEDDGDIEIDVVEGESKVAKRGTLKREAQSIEHKLTHKYKNPY
eukprot:s290_g29.t1